MLFCRGPVSEKSDESLFFIQKDDDVAQDETDAGPKPTPKLKRGLKPLRSEANLRLDSGIQGFAPRKRKKDKKTKASVSKKVAIKATLESRSDGQTASDDEREVPDSNSAEVMASSSDEEYDYSSSYSRIRQQQSAATAAKKPAKLPQVRPAMRDLWADDETSESMKCQPHQNSVVVFRIMHTTYTASLHVLYLPHPPWIIF